MKKMYWLLLAALSITNTLFAQAPTPDQLRTAIAQAVRQAKTPSASVGQVENRQVLGTPDSIPIRIYRPTSMMANLPLIYHVHGGAWVGGDLDTHDNICRRLCQDANAVVVAVHYRRPPEHPYPASSDDVMTVLNWIEANRAGLSPNGPLILLGDSAGGTFVASTSLRNAETAKPVPIAAQILINPALDIRPGSPAFETYEQFIRWGMPDISKTSEPYASPLISTQLKVMPPTSIVVNELDELREDGIQMDQKLRAAGVKSVLFEQKGIGHFGPVWCADHATVKPALAFVLQQIMAVSSPKR
ncbi:alpha/beta hydrolase [Spirosoma utsteinense]|uniref:alpha/beta hydrolase n=1 Tax=Spirosoma utsteinense TaxID=2585773 RepID=UPI001644286E|nr:alpha/beta hydrolase [Spirosoma utsteinense]MBC3789099.1 acetyl esterase [Spirosoma utsteinense]